MTQETASEHCHTAFTHDGPTHFLLENYSDDVTTRSQSPNASDSTHTYMSVIKKGLGALITLMLQNL